MTLKVKNNELFEKPALKMRLHCAKKKNIGDRNWLEKRSLVVNEVRDNGDMKDDFTALRRGMRRVLDRSAHQHSDFGIWHLAFIVDTHCGTYINC